MNQPQILGTTDKSNIDCRFVSVIMGVVSHMSPRQQDLVITIKKMTHEHGYPPTLSELAKAMNVSRTRIDQLARECERKGALAWEPGKARTWKVLIPAAGKSRPGGCSFPARVAPKTKPPKKER